MRKVQRVIACQLTLSPLVHTPTTVFAQDQPSGLALLVSDTVNSISAPETRRPHPINWLIRISHDQW